MTRASGSAPTFSDAQIGMPHGAGGVASRRLVQGLFAPAFSNTTLDALGDAAVLEVGAGSLAFTIDSFVVSPLVFPGGSIGELAVNGTVNDLAVSGARPVALSAAFVLEAGLASDVLRREVDAMARAAARAGVSIVAGDTKVVEHGKADGLYITTAGVGVVSPRAALGPKRVRTGDRVLLSGPIGAHGVTILIARAELELESELCSDSRRLTPFTSALLDALAHGVRWMRDATRGGVATVLNELSEASGCGVLIDDAAIPVDDAVRGACELLGLDPLHVANEGQFVAVVAGERANEALTILRGTPGGEQAAIIGEIVEDPHARVSARTRFGGRRVVDMLIGDPLPRIC